MTERKAYVSMPRHNGERFAKLMVEQFKQMNATLDNVGNSRPTGEEIVRCRDCEHFFPHFTRHDPDLPHYCETHGSDWVWPDGFCAWGVRNDA